MKMKTKSGSFVDMFRRFLPRLREKCKKAPRSHLSREQNKLLDKKKCELECLKKKARRVKLDTSRSIYAAAMAIEHLNYLEDIRGIGIPYRGEKTNQLNSWIRKGEKTIESVDRTINRLDVQIQEIDENPEEFLRKMDALEKD